MAGLKIFVPSGKMPSFRTTNQAGMIPRMVKPKLREATASSLQEVELFK